MPSSSSSSVLISTLQNMPFNYTNRRAFTLGYFALTATLFATPFIAVKYQL